jgi:O-antigen/teichoic acid export membrane protein
VTGLLGTLTVLVLSPWLSQFAFGNNDYTFAFVLLSITLLLRQLSSGQSVILQGMRKLEFLAKASIFGGTTALAISIPIYYIWSIDGIVTAILISSVLGLCISWYFANKIPIKKARVTIKEIFHEGRGMLQMGFIISLTSLISLGSLYILRVFISHQGGVAEVGLYNAGTSLILTYVGMIFTAMSKDYYPRLAGVAHDNKQAKRLINQQAEITILILGPLMAVFLIFIHWIVVLLFSQQFLAANGMVQYAAIGIFFKGASWSVAYVFLAKAASRLFFWSELIGNAYTLLFNLTGYYYFGLDGIGMSFLLSYAVYLCQVFVITKFLYDFSFTREFIRISTILLSIVVTCFFCVKFLPHPWPYAAGVPLICLSGWYSLKELDRRIGLLAILADLPGRFRK